VRLASFNPEVPANGRRRAALATVHMGAKALGIVDDDYRALLERVTGKRSAADCSNQQLDDVVDELRRLGFNRHAGAVHASAASHPVARKARAMWISLHQLGAIDDPAERALEAFASRQLGVERLQWADQRQGFRLIEALKAIGDRHGWDQRVSTRLPSREQVRLIKDRLVGAQLARLAEHGVPVDGPLAGDREGWSAKRLEGAAQELAARLREARG